MQMRDIVKSKVTDSNLVGWRRAQFIEAAIELFGRHGYHATKMRDIAEKAGVSIGLIYQYVEDKEDVLFLALIEVLDSYLREIPAAIAEETEPLARFRRAVHAYCSVNDTNVDATVLAYRETKSLVKARRNIIKQKELETNELMASVVRDCVDTGQFEAVDIELFVYQIVMFSHAWALKAWHFRDLMTVNEYVERGLNLMLNATLTPRGKRAYAALAMVPLPKVEKPARPPASTKGERSPGAKKKSGAGRRPKGAIARRRG